MNFDPRCIILFVPTYKQNITLRHHSLEYFLHLHHPTYKSMGFGRCARPRKKCFSRLFGSHPPDYWYPGYMNQGSTAYKGSEMLSMTKCPLKNYILSMWNINPHPYSTILCNVGDTHLIHLILLRHLRHLIHHISISETSETKWTSLDMYEVS